MFLFCYAKKNFVSLGWTEKLQLANLGLKSAATGITVRGVLLVPKRKLRFDIFWYF